MSKFIFLKSLPTILEPLKRLIDRKAQDVDWNENDSTSASYIANRTHYKSTELVAEVPETSVAFSYMEEAGLYLGQSSATLNVSEGDKRIIFWDGTRYECAVRLFDETLAIGNWGLVGQVDTGEPFLFMIIPDYAGGGLQIGTSDASATHTIGVYSEETVVHKIPEEYLPQIPEECMPPMNYVSYEDWQDLASIQKYIARENIGAGTSNFDGNYNSLTNKPTFAAVATSGSYNDLTNKPTLATVATSGSYNDLSDKLDLDNTLTSSGSAADAKAVGDAIGDLKGAKYEIAFIDQANGFVYCVTMRNGSLTSRCAIKSIEIVNAPTKTEYMAGDSFDPTGMVVMGTAHDGSTSEILNYSYQTGALTEGTRSVEIKYVEAGIVHTATVLVTVNAFDPETALVDFAYTDNGNGTYTITGWNGTFNGEASDQMIVPNNGQIII